MLKPCVDCGELSERARCEECRPSDNSRTPSRSRGYDGAWDRLSRRARKLQPFCTSCGATDDLQADHLPSAWERKERGLSVRLADVQVLCGPCNRAAGSSRRGSDRKPLTWSAEPKQM